LYTGLRRYDDLAGLSEIIIESLNNERGFYESC
jgi:hypothetical protein